MLEPENLFKIDNYHQWYKYILDIIDCKLVKPSTIKVKNTHKNSCMLFFENKGLENIGLPKIFRQNDIISLLPSVLQLEENIPTVVYKLSPGIGNKIFNYKDTVQNIIVNDNASVTTPQCDCQSSTFCENDLGHIVTGKFDIVENNKL